MSATVAPYGGDEVVRLDEEAVPVSAGTHGDALTHDGLVGIDRPIRGAADGNDGASPLVAGRLERELGLGQAQLVHADQGAQLRPRDRASAGHEGEQEGVVRALDDASFDDAGRRDAEQLGRLEQAAGSGGFADLDVEPLRAAGRIPHPAHADRLRHQSDGRRRDQTGVSASGAASGSSATQSSSSARSACHAA